MLLLLFTSRHDGIFRAQLNLFLEPSGFLPVIVVLVTPILLVIRVEPFLHGQIPLLVTYLVRNLGDIDPGEELQPGAGLVHGGQLDCALAWSVLLPIKQPGNDRFQQWH